MIYARRQRQSSSDGFYRFESAGRRVVFGEGYGDFIRLRDENGKEWRGWAEQLSGDLKHYRFRDSDGGMVSGISDSFGIILRDERGKVWRGFVD